MFTLNEILINLSLNENVISTLETLAASTSKIKSLKSVYQSVISCVQKHGENYGEQSLELARCCR